MISGHRIQYHDPSSLGITEVGQAIHKRLGPIYVLTTTAERSRFAENIGGIGRVEIECPAVAL